MACAFPERPPCGDCSLCQLRKANAKIKELEDQLQNLKQKLSLANNQIVRLRSEYILKGDV